MSKRITLRIVDGYGAAIPVRMGIPFPKGALMSAGHTRLVDPEGGEVPFDSEAAALWDDGSVRWLRIDTVAPRQYQRLYMQYGPRVRRTARGELRIEEDEEKYFVDTGMLQFELHKKQFGVLRNCRVVTVRGDTDALGPEGIDFITKDFFRRTRFASKDHSNYMCTLEEQGANHAVFRISGVHDDKRGKLLDYHTRLYCYAGSAAVRLSHTVCSRQEEELPVLRSIQIRVPAADSPIVFSSGMEGDYVVEEDVPGQGIALLQTGPTRMKPEQRFQYAQNGEMIGRRGEGWMTASGEVVGITTAVRRFWQRLPKGFRVTANAIHIDLWPEEAEEVTVVPRGTQRTYEVMLLFHGVRDVELMEAAVVGRAFTRPPYVVCQPSWYCSSQALGEMTTAGTKGFEKFGRAAAGAFAALKRRRSRLREYGDFDFGDFADTDGVDCWYNVEYDTPHCLFVQFARTGKRDYLDWGVDAALHQGDVDIAHFVPTDPSLVGSQSIHATGHLGRESKWFYYRTDHIWAQGLVKAYWLTGDRIHLENAELVGDYLARVAPCPEDGGAERPYGWSLIGLMAVYEATQDRKYLTAASKIVETVLSKAHPERGLWQREWGTNSEGKPILGSSPFMSGVLVEGLIDYNSVARDPRVDDFVVKAARTWIREAWIEKDGGFYYHPGAGQRERGRPADSRQLLGLVRAYELTSDPEILRVMIKYFNASVDAHLTSLERNDVKGGAANNAKNFAIFLRSTPRFIAIARRLGIELQQ